MYESAALKLHNSICVPEIVCVAGEIVRQREQSFGRGSAKPCRECQGDALNFLARFDACYSRKSHENGSTLTRAKTIPPASMQVFSLNFRHFLRLPTNIQRDAPDKIGLMNE